MEELELQIIKEKVEQFFRAIDIVPSEISVKFDPSNDELAAVSVQLDEPQMIIGQNGQTLVDVQRLVRLCVCRAIKKNIRVSLDINDYKNKKMQHVRQLAQSAASEVLATGSAKILPPMPAYERMVVHQELANHQDVVTESQGEGQDRHIVIKTK